MTRGRAVIIGAGGHAVSLLETVGAAGYTVIAFTSDRHENETLLGLPVLDDVPFADIEAGASVFVAIGDNATRERVWMNLARRVPAAQMPAVIHPSASVSEYATVGAGTVIMQRSVVGSGAVIGLGCIVNSASILDHESRMGDFSSLAPGVVTGGRVSIGPRSAVSIGAVIKHGVAIGADTVLGAASYAHADIDDGVVAYGVPAKVVRSRAVGDPYLY